MSAAKHTPGPRKAYEDTNEQLAFQAGWREGHAAAAEAYADLLKALQALVSDPRMSDDEDSTVEVCWEDVRDARAAIAKATGSAS